VFLILNLHGFNPTSQIGSNSAKVNKGEIICGVPQVSILVVPNLYQRFTQQSKDNNTLSICG
jgi:hypothetical protein